MKRKALYSFLPSKFAVLLLPLLGAWPQARAADLYWDNSGGTANGWAFPANWSTSVVGGVDPAAFPGAADVAIFSADNLSAAQTVDLGGNRAVGGLVFNESFAHTIQGGGTNRTLTLGASGISKTGTGAANVGSTTTNQNVALALSADQTWTNSNNTGAIVVNNGVSSNAAGIRILTLGGSSTAVNNVVGAINNGTGVVSISRTGATGGIWQLSGANGYSGGTTISGGILRANNNAALGLGTVSFPAAGAGRLQINAGMTVANNINIAGGVTGTTGAGLIETNGTGQGISTGEIFLGGPTTAGGTFRGGTAVGSELVLRGPILGGSGTQRDGRVIYAGGGLAVGNFTVTNTMIVGATDGVPKGWNLQLGGSAAATLNLNGFDQTLAGVRLGNGGNAFAGTILLGDRTLTLTSELSSLTSTAAANNLISGDGGSVVLPGSGRTIAVGENTSSEDLGLSGLIIDATGGVTKTGAGTLALSNVTFTGALNVTDGTLKIGRTLASGTVTAPAVNFQGAAKLQIAVGTGGSVLNGGAVTASATAVEITQAGNLMPGSHDLVTYTGTSPGVGNFLLSPLPGRLQGNLVDTGNAIALNVTSNDSLLWTGVSGTAWDAANNWNLASDSTQATFVPGDVVAFGDSPASTTVDIPTAVAPTMVTFSNTDATAYLVTGAAGISGNTGLLKTGNGTVTLRNPNSYSGPTTVNGGTLELDHDAAGNAVLTATGGISLAVGSTLKLSRDDGDIAFSRSVSGAGTVLIDPHSLPPGAGSRSVTLSGNNSGFSGKWQLTPGVTGSTATFRVSSATQSMLGTAAVQVDDGAQLWTSGATNNNVTITGIGFSETAGSSPAGLAAQSLGVYVGSNPSVFGYAGLGAIRLTANDVFSGNITIHGNAKLMAWNGTATVAGNVTAQNPTDVLHVGGGTSGSTNVFTGTVTTPQIVVNTGSAASNVQHSLQIGNGGTTGEVASPEIILYGSPRADFAYSALLHVNRSDAYTIPSGQAVRGAAAVSADLYRTRVLANTPGLEVNGTIDLSDGIGGGLLSAGSTRNSAINFNSTAVVDVNYLSLGEASAFTGTVNQINGSQVTVLGQVRVGHFGAETSTYNMTGGTLTLTGSSPVNTPSTDTAGGASATGDNNIEAEANNRIVGGGIYLGIDGTGIFNHTGGTVTTNWIVLDNRGNSGPATGMDDGIDQYNLGGTGILRLRSTYGIIARNPSTAVTFGGGTVMVDNTGSGTGTGANLAIPLATLIQTVSTTTTKLDTGGTGNRFVLNRDVLGDGTLDIDGGGAVEFSTATTQLISPNLTGDEDIIKTGVGTTELTGSSATLNADISVNGGTLILPATLDANSITVADGATLQGEPQPVNTLTLGNATLRINPLTAGALTTTDLVINGNTLLALAAVPTAANAVTAINYTTKSGTGTFAAANAAAFRSAPVVNDTGSAITVDFGVGKNLLWTGAADANWNIGATQNWNDGIATDVFFTLDNLTFGEGGNNSSITLAGTLQPGSILVNSDTTPYTFTSTAGNQLAGPTGIRKTGASVLTLNGPNLYRGKTSVEGGTLAYSGSDALGDAGAVSNSIELSNGGRLVYTGATAADLGLNRRISVGTGGGTLAHNNAAAATITIPGAISGSEPLSILSTAAGAGTVLLGGANSGYTGEISINSGSTGLTTLSFASQAAMPNASSITVNYPAAGASGTANTLNLPGIQVPVGTTLKMNSLTSGAINLRSQVTSSGASSINGPLEVTGTAIIQFNSANGLLSLNGAVTAGTGGFSNVFFVRGTGNGEVNGTITLPQGRVSKTDGGSWRMNASGNTWTETGVLVGSLVMGAHDVLPPAATLLVGQNDTNTASLNLNGFNQTTSRLYSNPTVVGANSTGKSITSPTPATLTANQTLDGIYASVFTGAVSLTKSGPATLTLLGASTHTGTTSVTEGILSVGNSTGSATGTGPVMVGPAGTLAGNGSMAGTLAVEGVISPGVGLATLSAGSTTLKATSTYTCEINSASLAADLIAIRGDLVIENGAILNLADLGAATPASGSKFVLASYTGSRTGTFNGMADGATVTVGTNAYTINYQDSVAGKGAVTLTLSAPYATWAASYQLNVQTDGAPGADPDGDGVLNIMEFATNANPTNPSSRPRVYGKVFNLGGADVLTLTIAVRSGATFAAAAESQTATKDTVTYTVEASEALSTWNEVVTELNAVDSAALQNSLSLPVLDSGWEWHSFRTDGATNTDIIDFIRLRVQQ